MKKHQKTLLRIIISLVLFTAGLLAPLSGHWRLILFVPAYLTVGYDIIIKAARNIVRGSVMDENFLMTVATVSAFLLGEYAEGVAVMLFYQIGEGFNHYAVERSRKSISGLLSLRPDFARVQLPDGSTQERDPYDVRVGDIILVKVGERVPLDGELVSGKCVLDTSALTGESMPREVEREVLSGSINLDSVITLRVTGDFESSTVNRILEMVESASNKKAKAENFITKFARFYTPIVVFSALALAVIPSIITGQWTVWIQRALVFLVVSCPCALVISVPLTFFSGIGAFAKAGVMVKGGSSFDVLSKIQTVALDKTGTVTKGRFDIVDAVGITVDKQELISLAASAEYYSTHPIARCIVGAAERATPPESNTEHAGGGCVATVKGKEVAVGSSRLMASLGVNAEDARGRIFVSVDKELAGYIDIADTVKEDSVRAIAELNKMGISTVMLTGDTEAVAQDIAQKVGIKNHYSSLLPDEKVERIEQLLSDGKCAFVGDGINDAPVLARADVGISMGKIGSDAAIEAADIIIMNDSLTKIPLAIRLAKRIMRICSQNIVFSLVIKIGVLVLGALGYANMWLAVFADVGVSVLAVLNAMRAMIWKEK